MRPSGMNLRRPVANNINNLHESEARERRLVVVQSYARAPREYPVGSARNEVVG